MAALHYCDVLIGRADTQGHPLRRCKSARPDVASGRVSHNTTLRRCAAMRGWLVLGQVGTSLLTRRSFKMHLRQLVRPFVPEVLVDLRNLYIRTRPVKERLCPICNYEGYFENFGKPPRLDARCP